jgi:hypothetical protein
VKKNVAAFFKDFEALTSRHPAVRYQRLWRYQVGLEVTAHYGQVYLRRIWAVKPGEGHGTECLRWLLMLVKKHGVVMIGHASRPSDLAKGAPGPGVMALRRWYRSHGAKFDRHGAFTFTGEGVRL